PRPRDARRTAARRPIARSGWPRRCASAIEPTRSAGTAGVRARPARPAVAASAVADPRLRGRLPNEATHGARLRRDACPSWGRRAHRGHTPRLVVYTCMQQTTAGRGVQWCRDTRVLARSLFLRLDVLGVERGLGPQTRGRLERLAVVELGMLGL